MTINKAASRLITRHRQAGALQREIAIHGRDGHGTL